MEVLLLGPSSSDLPPPWWMGHPCPQALLPRALPACDAYQTAEASRTLELLLK